MKKNLLLFIPSLHRGGGAERVFFNLLWHLDRDSVDQITLLTLNNSRKNSYDIPNDVKWDNLGVSRTLYAFFPLLKYLIRNKPTIILSTAFRFDFLLGFASLFLVKKPFLVARIINSGVSFFPFWLTFFGRFIYSRFDRVICQSRYMKDEVISLFQLRSKPVSVIYNPLDFDRISKLASETFVINEMGSRSLISVGSLTRQKNFSFLLDVMSQIGGDYRLFILGDGPEKEMLLDKVNALKLEDRVFFLGFQDNVYKYLSNASVYLSSSLYEGMPNAVLESFACGLPVVSLEYTCIREIIHKENGIVVETADPKLFADAIKTMCDFSSDVIRQDAMSRYNVSDIVKEYERVLYA